MKNQRFSVTNALEIWNAGVKAVDAASIVENAICLGAERITIAGQKFNLDLLRKIIVVGFGKCSGAMAVGVESALRNLPERITLSGLINSPAGQEIATQRIEVVGCRPATSNYPTETVVLQTRRIMKLIEGADEETLIVALVSGGGSALFEDPLVPLEDLVTVSKLISGRSASIESLNIVRRSLSRVKAGGLARHVLNKTPSQLVGLVISDVIGDRMEMVASGPTILSTETHRQRQLAALDVLANSKTEDVPNSIFQLMQVSHFAEEITEPDSLRISNHLLANNATAVQGAIRRAENLGFSVVVSELDVNRDVEVVAKDWATLVKRLLNEGISSPTTIVVGGEPTVELCVEPGCGGRNLQLSALLMREMVDCELFLRSEMAFLSGGSDGEDGSAPVAGAGFDAQTLREVAADSQLRAALDRAIVKNDCYAFFESIGVRVLPPAMSTNVCDIQVLLIGQTASD